MKSLHSSPSHKYYDGVVCVRMNNMNIYIWYNLTMSISLLLETILKTAQEQIASDIHISTGRVPVLRVHRDLIPLLKSEPLNQEDVFNLIVEMAGNEKAKRLLLKEEIDFSYQFGDSMRLRGNAFIRSGAFGIALRIIPEIQAFENLNLPVELKEFAKKEQGFFLIVGPTGHGKSTCMASLMNYINNTRKEHIVTIEHPIEFLFDDAMSIVDQREVEIDTDSFASALRAAFREDIDVIMIGEMRDAITMSTAVTAAETGHLVFSTLHTNDATQTIDRIVQSFGGPEQDQIRSQLAGALLGIFSMRLIPRIRGGLIPAYELLINNSAVSNLIREARTHEIKSVIETSREDGMIDMNHSLLDLVRRNEITIDDALRYSLDAETLKKLF